MALDSFEIALKAFPYNASALYDYLYLLIKNECTAKAQMLVERWGNLLRTEGRGKERLIRGLLAEASGEREEAVSNYRASLRALKSNEREYIRSRISELTGVGDNDGD